jgi:hypothetical protein
MSGERKRTTAHRPCTAPLLDSTHAALDTATCAPFSKERRMEVAKATNFNRKSGEAEESAVSASQYQMLTGKPFCSSRAAYLPAASRGRNEQRLSMGNVSVTNELSSRPERTRISCHAALDKATCAPFRRERRMKFTNATKFDRKSGGAEWRDLRFTQPASNSTGSPVVVH